ncbi:MAG TPA: type VI secretion system baseplate subunit TssG [Polyangiaceae bacterium]|nr:type VI secretion system baseplate subunit TssG [Polyangiaceae bacterium]
MTDLSVVAAPGSAANSDELANSISHRAREFQLGALVTLLERKFPGRALRFRSQPSMGPRPSPVQEIRFQDDAVVVTLNLGFFSSTSSLPSYFLEWLVGPEPVSSLEAILGVLDDRLLRDRAQASAVHESPRLIPREAALRRNLLQLARPASSATLHWVFSRIFPELGISVVRAGVQRALSSAELRLGQAQLGYTAMGGSADLRSPGHDVFLCTGESLTWSGEPWAEQARRRIDQIAIPVLAESAPELRIVLVDFEGSGRLSLVRGSSLGFDPLTRAQLPHTILLYEGRFELTI